MTSPFTGIAKELIYQNGITVNFVTITEGTYDSSTGSVTNTESITSIKAFPRSVKATQYNYPNLIDKEVIEFLAVAEDIPFKPKPTDKIVKDSQDYIVDRVSEHYADGLIIAYKILTARG